MQNKFLAINLFYKQAKVWLHVTLTYVFIAAIIATLFCAYLKEVNQTVITVLLILGGLYGSFKAKNVRKSTGLLQYKNKHLISHDFL